jgi:predicted phosphodiesterase
MRYGIISDIHANLEALETALEHLRAEKAEAFICLGDIVGYGPNPNEVVERVQNLPGLICLAGNHDLAAIGKYDTSTFNPYARDAIVWTTGQLSTTAMKFLLSLPLRRQAYPLELVHGALPEPMDYITDSSEARMTFAEMRNPICFVGHTHVSEYYKQKQESEFVQHVPLFSGGELTVEFGFRYIVNVGSVGQPRDGNPKLSCAMWDDTTYTITLSRLPYDIKRVQKQMSAVGLPKYLGERLGVGR